MSRTRSKSEGADPGILWLYGIRFLAALALLISGYLAWTALRSGHLPGCGPESGCDEVLSSRWGYWLGVPVSLGALPVYALVLTVTFVLPRSPSLTVRRNTWLILIAAAAIILGSVSWFVGIQWFVLHKFCRYCMAAHGCGLVAAGLILYRLPLAIGPIASTAGSGRLMSSSAAGRAVLVGLAAVGALGAGQMLHEPRTFDVTPLASLPAGPEAARRVGPANPTASVLASAPPESNSSASISVQHPGSAALASRELALHGGAFRLDLKTLPLLGLEDAPQTIVSLFDYTCSHCRQLHRPLMEAYRSLSSRLAIVSLPVPVDPLCNPLTKHPVPEQTNGCTYARLGLAVWRANRQQLEAFDDWMFSFPRPPSTNEVRARAESLVGAANLAKALADPWIEDLIRMDIRLYHTNYLVYRKSRLPQLIIGTNLVVGVARSPEDIYRLLSGQPGFVAPNLARATNVPAATR